MYREKQELVKSTRARGTEEETKVTPRKRPLGRSFASSRAACFALPNRSACSQAKAYASA